MDLWGRLSNPDDVVETLVGQGITEDGRVPRSRSERVSRPAESDRQGPSGPLSNPTPPAPFTARRCPPDDRDTPPTQPSRPVQRRLRASGIEKISQHYISGTSIAELARSYGVNRTTIITHLDHQGVHRRRVARKMTDLMVAEAAVRYLAGRSLTSVADEFRIHAKTLSREFHNAGIAIRPRPGWKY